MILTVFQRFGKDKRTLCGAFGIASILKSQVDVCRCVVMWFKSSLGEMCQENVSDDKKKKFPTIPLDYGPGQSLAVSC